MSDAAPSPSEPPDFFWLLFRLKGRIGRQVFLLANVLLSCLAALPLWKYINAVPGTVAADNWYALFQALFIAAVWPSIALGVKRLHDVNKPGVATVALFFPFIQVLAFAALCLIPGTPGPNAYGERTDAPG